MHAAAPMHTGAGAGVGALSPPAPSHMGSASAGHDASTSSRPDAWRFHRACAALCSAGISLQTNPQNLRVLKIWADTRFALVLPSPLTFAYGGTPCAWTLKARLTVAEESREAVAEGADDKEPAEQDTLDLDLSLGVIAG